MSIDARPFEPGDPVRYGGYEHTVTALRPRGQVTLDPARPGVAAAFQGYTHIDFVTPREPRR